MNQEKIYEYKLRVPSQMEVATTSNLWKFVQLVLPKIPDIFKNSDVAGIKEFPLNNEYAIARTLAYIKYLDIITEERKHDMLGEKSVSKQFFHLTEKGKSLKKTAILEPENLYNEWKKVLKESQLYNALVTNEEFIQYNQISRITLRKLLTDSFSKKVKNIKERVDKAEDYIINFLREVELFTFDGNQLHPISESKMIESGEIMNGINKIDENETSMKPEFEDKEFGGVSKINQFRKEDFYHAETEDYELWVRYDELAIEMLQMQIDIAKTKLKSIKKENNQNGGDNVE